MEVVTIIMKQMTVDSWTGVGACYTPDDEGYPKQFLSDTLTHRPKHLYMLGNTDLLNTPILAVVGSRKCSAYGERVSKAIGELAAEIGITIVSGMASGIDSIAQRACLHRGGNVIAVIAHGFNKCYPAENRGLMKEIADRGLLVTEYDPDTTPKRYMFPNRNRLIVALSDAVTIVEASFHSGALNTAEHAVDQNKLLMVVPGQITSPSSVGTNRLIQYSNHEDVHMVCSINEIFEQLGYVPTVKKSVLVGNDEQKVLDTLEVAGELLIEELGEKTGFSPQHVNGLVTVLEMKGLVVTSMGRAFLA